MKTNAGDPWRGTHAETTVDGDDAPNDRFEDSFLDESAGHRRLSDSEQYLQKLCKSSPVRHFFLFHKFANSYSMIDSRLKILQGRTARKDLVTSLSAAKEDCIARLITSGNNPQSEEEAELASNPLIRHIAPHLQVNIWRMTKLSRDVCNSSPSKRALESRKILSQTYSICLGFNCRRIGSPPESRRTPSDHTRTRTRYRGIADKSAVSRAQSGQLVSIKSTTWSAMSIEALSGKVFLLVTGASRGIGRQIAITFGSLLEEGSRALLLARSKDALQEVASNIPSKVKIHIVNTDLSKSNNIECKGKLKFLSSKSNILIIYYAHRDAITENKFVIIS